MKVENILQSKGAVVHTVEVTAKIAEAVRLLNEHNIGAIVVVDAKSKVVGILSERDIVRRMQTDSTTVMLETIKTCMTGNPVTCGIEATVNDLMQIMSERRIRHIPVVDDGRLIGLISIGDVVKRKIMEAEQEAEALREYIAS